MVHKSVRTLLAALPLLAVAGLSTTAAAGPNVALTGTATQDQGIAPASRAIDGNTSGNHNHGSVALAGLTVHPWWQVQLTGDFLIDSIVVWGRTDCCMDRLGNFRVSVFDGATEVFGENHVWTQLVQLDVDHRKLEIDLAPNVSGDRVRIEILDNVFQWLELGEVQVFEADVAVPAPPVLALLGLGLIGLFGFRSRQRSEP